MSGFSAFGDQKTHLRGPFHLSLLRCDVRPVLAKIGRERRFVIGSVAPFAFRAEPRPDD